MTDLSAFFSDSNIDSTDFDLLPELLGSTFEAEPLTPNGDLGFHPLLPIELALKSSSIETILESYGLTQDQFLDISAQPAFVSAYKDAQEVIKEDGGAFKLKAKMQAEEMLKVSWKLVHDKESPPSVRADLIKWTARVAGYDKKETADGINPTQALQININLG